MQYVTHPLIKTETLEAREYQSNIVKQALNKNLLCVLPTGLGKTPIAIMLAAHRLEQFPESRILVLAPTKPLTAQNCNAFKKFLDIGEKDFQIVTGATPAQNREGFYRTKSLIFATPQTIENDIKNSVISLNEFSLLVIDEAHHSIGKYSYPHIAEKYLKESEHPRILALTASPGATKEKIDEIYRSLGIEIAEIKTERDSDVSPYVQERDTEWVGVELPGSFVQIKKLIDEAYYERIGKLKRMGLRKPVRAVGRKDLLALQQALFKLASRGEKTAFWAVSAVSQAIKLDHALGLLETQGISSLENYWKKLVHEKSKGSQSIVADSNISKAMHLTDALYEAGSRHPKMSRLCSIVSQQLGSGSESKIIIFANYRETVKEIVSILENMDNARPVMLIGQKAGLTQKAQIESIRRFDEGEHNILVGTSISEEGLHLGSADIAIFYEPVPSEIRSIQRRGRVGRTKVGKIIILYTKRTRDEAYMWAAHHKEKRMKSLMHDMRAGSS